MALAESQLFTVLFHSDPFSLKTGFRSQILPDNLLTPMPYIWLVQGGPEKLNTPWQILKNSW